MRTVEISASKRYDVIIGHGLMERAGELLKARMGLSRAVIVADDSVDALYGEKTQSSMERAGYETMRWTFPRGEGSKTLATYGALLEFLAEMRLTRADALIALGGGVTGDLTGFAAATFLRGVRFAQIPTTLLAAVDSSVGGKTAVDLSRGKNLAGAFWQPSAVVCDTDTFSTLPEGTFLDGVAEALKTGIIADEALFGVFKAPDYKREMESIVERCVRIKGDIVQSDEFDTGRRQLLNFGHTVGHAIEKLSGFSISHGHCVAMGMAVETRAAEKLGLAERGSYDCIAGTLAALGLPFTAGYAAEAVLDAALSDKKRSGEEITLVIPARIGECALWKTPVTGLAGFIRAGMEV